MNKMQKQAAAAAVPGGLVVAVVGSRGVGYSPALNWRLRELHDDGLLAALVSGGASGVDSQAAEYARAAGLRCTEHLPDYRAHGPGAPLVRNGLIVAAADLVLVVWDGQSRGTLDAARRATRLGKPVEWLAYPAPSAAPVPSGLGL